MKELVVFIIFIIALGVIWSMTGGPDRAISREGWFLSPQFNSEGSRSSGLPYVELTTTPTTVTNTTDEVDRPAHQERSGSAWDFLTRFRAGTGDIEEEVSPHSGSVTLSVGSARSSDPNSEYIIIRTDRNLSAPVTISGWRLESTATGLGATIGQGAPLPFVGQINTEFPISLGANITAYVTTGRSPIGTSFRTNMCTGYIQQFQSFSPRLSTSCPRPMDELYNSAGINFVPNEECVRFVERIPRCTFTQTQIPGNVGSQCQTFILETLTYNGCMNNHRNKADFYGNEWRIYLARDQALWRSSTERIRLLDENGKVVDAVTY